MLIHLNQLKSAFPYPRKSGPRYYIVCIVYYMAPHQLTINNDPKKSSSDMAFIGSSNCRHVFKGSVFLSQVMYRFNVFIDASPFYLVCYKFMRSDKGGKFSSYEFDNAPNSALCCPAFNLSCRRQIHAEYVRHSVQPIH